MKDIIRYAYYVTSANFYGINDSSNLALRLLKAKSFAKTDQSVKSIFFNFLAIKSCDLPKIDDFRLRECVQVYLDQ